MSLIYRTAKAREGKAGYLMTFLSGYQIIDLYRAKKVILKVANGLFFVDFLQAKVFN